MPDFGISEAIAAFAPEIFGAADAGVAAADAGLAAGLETGVGTIGSVGEGFAGGLAGLGSAAGSSAGLADLVGTGTGLAAGETGLAGTAAASGMNLADLAGTGVGSLTGIAGDFIGAPGASGFGAMPGSIQSGALGAGADASGANAAAGAFQPQDFGSATSVGGSTQASGTGFNPGKSVFDTGTAPITSSPGANSASALSAPAGTTPQLGVDPTAAATGITPTAAAPPAAQSTSIESLLGKMGNGVTDSITKNPLGIALGVGGLGYNILNGQKQTPNQNALSSNAAAANANSGKLVDQGEALTKYLTDGTLPPAYQSQVDQAIKDAKTRAISNAASQGLPTDPTMNTALASTLAGIDNQRGAMQAQIAQTLFSSGTSLINAGQSSAGLSGQLYQALVQNDTTQAANTGKAIATLAAAMNGKSSANAGGITISQG